MEVVANWLTRSLVVLRQKVISESSNSEADGGT